LSGLFSNPAFVPLAVLSASLLGSGHCVAMCGGLIASTTKTRADVTGYHLGRLAGYTTLGALAGFLGERVFREASVGILPWVATAMLAGGLILSGVRVWTGNGMHLQILPSALLQRLYAKSQGSAWRFGLLSAFLPCGWLHTFVLASLATRSALYGALLLLFFWLGTLPALSAAPLVIHRVLKPMSEKLPRLSASLLIIAGVITLGIKIQPHVAAQNAIGEQQVMTCHSPMHH
jgi:sulfite exporter TauE/SafE